MSALSCNVSAETALAGVNVRVADYRWNANERISDRHDGFALLYRSHPAQVSLAASMGEGRVQDFGQLMFFPASTDVETTPAAVAERARNVVCTFAADWFRRVWPDCPDRPEWTGGDLALCYDMRNDRIEQAMRRIGGEAASPGFASGLMVESLAQFIAVEIARHFNRADGPRRLRTSEGRFSARELDCVYDFVDGARTGSLTTMDIARQLGISPAHLRRSFKRTTGLSLHTYVAGARLRKAQALLGTTDLPLKEVAFRLGFTSSSTFSSTFRNAAGETPGGYRKRLRAKG